MMTEQTKSMEKKSAFAGLLESTMGKLKTPIEVELAAENNYKIIRNALLARTEYKNAVLQYESISKYLMFDNDAEETLIQASYENMKRAEQVLALNMQIVRAHNARWDWTYGTDAIQSSSFDEFV